MNKLGNTFAQKFALSLTLLSFLVLFAVPFATTADASSYTVNAWWPTNGAHMTGTQPFKAEVTGLDVSQYDMFWQVDGGQLNSMSNNNTDSPHKEASVNVSSWTWHGSGPYVVNFVAQQNGNTIAQQSETIYVDNGLPQQGSTPVEVASTPAQTPTLSLVQNTITASPLVAAPAAATDSDPAHAAQMQSLVTAVQSGADTDPVHAAQVQTYLTTTVQTQTPALVQNSILASPLVSVAAVVANNSSSKFYVSPTSEAATQAVVWATSNPAGAAAMQVLAAQPTATWFGDWNSNIENDVHTLVSAATAEGTVPVMVAYNIPERDCGGFSAGGSDNPAGYTSWINSFAQGLGNSSAMIVLEPDALAEITCLSAADQATRLQLLSSAVSTLKADPNAKVYIDAGHSAWIDPTTMAGELTKANVAQADGFSLNVSNFMPTANEVAYGQQVSSLISGKHFVVDTSRNGNGSDGQWCNPPGMAIGQTPTTQTGNSLADAFLWLKTPGESDGTCNGGPAAGVWWPDYALSLVQNAH